MCIRDSDHIVPTFLNTASVTNGGLNYDQKQQLKTKRLLAAQGFYELSLIHISAVSSIVPAAVFWH